MMVSGFCRDCVNPVADRNLPPKPTKLGSPFTLEGSVGLERPSLGSPAFDPFFSVRPSGWPFSLFFPRFPVTVHDADLLLEIRLISMPSVEGPTYPQGALEPLTISGQERSTLLMGTQQAAASTLSKACWSGQTPPTQLPLARSATAVQVCWSSIPEQRAGIGLFLGFQVSI